MDINCAAIEQYLHEQIPLSKTIGISVVSINESGVVLSAPLLPNINHRSTAFGGSISAVAILSAWTFVYVQLQRLSFPCRIVIQNNHIEYLKPIDRDFQAHCFTPALQDWQRFLTAVSRRGKGRILLNAEVYSEGILASRFQGEYVALKLKEPT